MVLNYKLNYKLSYKLKKVLMSHTTVGLSFFYFLVYMELCLQSMAVRQRVSLHRIWKGSVQITFRFL